MFVPPTARPTGFMQPSPSGSSGVRKPSRTFTANIRTVSAKGRIFLAGWQPRGGPRSCHIPHAPSEGAGGGRSAEELEIMPAQCLYIATRTADRRADQAWPTGAAKRRCHGINPPRNEVELTIELSWRGQPLRIPGSCTVAAVGGDLSSTSGHACLIAHALWASCTVVRPWPMTPGIPRGLPPHSEAYLFDPAPIVHVWFRSARRHRFFRPGSSILRGGSK